MQNTIRGYLANLRAQLDQRCLNPILSAIANVLSSQATVSAGLVIKAGGSALAKTGATAFQGVANGVPVTIAPATDMPALTGLNIGAGRFNVACFFIDAASALTMVQGTEGATLAGVVFPQFPEKKALVGYLIITYASAFTGGTTPLDTATTVYVSPVGAFDPSILIG